MARSYVKTTTCILAFLLASAAPSGAHEWEHPHHDEGLTIDQARTLGFQIRINEVEWYDREQKTLLDAVGILIDYPTAITGEQIVAADYSSGCDPLHVNSVEELADDGLPTETVRYSTDHVFPADCVDDAVFWAIYGAPVATTFYWIGLHGAK